LLKPSLEATDDLFKLSIGQGLETDRRASSSPLNADEEHLFDAAENRGRLSLGGFMATERKL
jgi:hypothetical protein